jgi:hypothetical protein
MRAALALFGVSGLCAACADVLGIPKDTPSFCAQPSNQGHAYCEDFDVGDPSARWTLSEALGGATSSLRPSDDSPPNLLDLSATSADGGSSLAGFTKEFDDATFVGLHIEADVRFVTQNGASLPDNAGFLLVVDKSGGCVGIGLAGGGASGLPGVGAIVFADPTGCSALNGGTPSRDASAGGPPQSTYITGTPPLNQWFHVIVVVTPDATGTGAGTLTFDIAGEPSPGMPVPLSAGTLTSNGVPLVGFAAEINGQGGSLEVQYDNVWIDLRAN